MRRGFIEAIGSDVQIPSDAQVLAGDSLLVYPGIVDAEGGAEVEFPELEINRQELEPWNAPREAQGFLPHSMEWKHDSLLHNQLATHHVHVRPLQQQGKRLRRP